MAPNGGTSSRTPFPPEFRMDPIFLNLLSCDLPREQWIEICRYRLEYLKKCAQEEVNMFNGILNTIK